MKIETQFGYYFGFVALDIFKLELAMQIFVCTFHWYNVNILDVDINDVQPRKIKPESTFKTNMERIHLN